MKRREFAEGEDTGAFIIISLLLSVCLLVVAVVGWLL